MCFSAEASFTVGAILGAIGVVALKKIRDKSRILLALIPIVFGIQQIAEGFVWLNLSSGLEPPSCCHSGQYIFLLSAWVIWPTLIPIAVLLPEKILWRKIVCLICLGIGLYISYIDMIYLLNLKTAPEIVGRSIYYGESPIYQYIFYAIATIVPFFVSSIRRLWFFGFLMIFFFSLSYFIWAMTFTSVWCFFAALSSLFLLKVIIPDKS